MIGHVVIGLIARQMDSKHELVIKSQIAKVGHNHLQPRNLAFTPQLAQKTFGNVEHGDNVQAVDFKIDNA